MTPELLLQHLEDLLAKLGVIVRSEPFDLRSLGVHASRGGICRVRDRTIVVVDSHALICERIAILAEAAASLHTESVFILPAVRQVIDAHKPRVPRDIKRPTLRLVTQTEARPRRKKT